MVDTGDSNWKTIRVYPEGSTTFTLYYLQPDTEYEFQVYSRNLLGEGLPSSIIKAKTKGKRSNLMTFDQYLLLISIIDHNSHG